MWGVACVVYVAMCDRPYWRRRGYGGNAALVQFVSNGYSPTSGSTKLSDQVSADDTQTIRLDNQRNPVIRSVMDEPHHFTPSRISVYFTGIFACAFQPHCYRLTIYSVAAMKSLSVAEWHSTYSTWVIWHGFESWVGWAADAVLTPSIHLPSVDFTEISTQVKAWRQLW